MQKPPVPDIDSKMNNTSRRNEVLEASAKGIFFGLRVYEKDNTDINNEEKLSLHQRISVSAQDVIISFNESDNQKRKVLGTWSSTTKPKSTTHPFIQLSLVSYEDTSNKDAGLESRLYIMIMPIRCFLDDAIVSFVKDLLQPFINESSSSQPSKEVKAEVKEPNQSSPSLIYFQYVSVSSIDLKINYKGSSINLNALHKGDYMQ